MPIELPSTMRIAMAEIDLNLLMKALSFAARKHRKQLRKGSEPIPYINHPIAVAELIIRTGKIRDGDTIAAALLHDTVEDTETTFEELEAEFGPVIAKLVAEVTDNKKLAKEERKRLQVEHASSLSARARIIKLADKTCNLRDVVQDPPAGWKLERKQEYFDWGKSVVDKMGGGINAELEKAFAEAFAARPKS
jgi:GTP diphosphokinase / guanosine-3',5'-bis(diphosphate) 3'-diphosphatase